MGVRIPSWVSSLTNLVKFELNENRRLQYLPPLNQLPYLKYISLVKTEALEYISDEDSVSNMLGGSSSSSKTPFFPSLSSIRLCNFPKLKGWWRNLDDDENESHHLLLPSFPPCLSNLEIIGCRNLTSMLLFPYFKEKLQLHSSSWKILEQTMKMGATTSTYFPLSQLEVLVLDHIIDLESLLEEGLQNLVSLRKLYIERCDGLGSLSLIGILTSLQQLSIWRCPKLMSLPQGIRNLSSLKQLEINDRPLLRQRCETQAGEDWPIIAHVSCVIVDYENQQEERNSAGMHQSIYLSFNPKLKINY